MFVKKYEIEDIKNDIEVNNERTLKNVKILKILIETIRDKAPEQDKSIYSAILKSLTYWG